MMDFPILYSFRRCPYAMRARMGLRKANIDYEHREVILRDKPAHMLEISPKATVPVLLLPSGQVIDESLDIMHWALNQNDPDQWLSHPHKHDIYTLIDNNDETFKSALDRYKYPNRYPDEDCSNARTDGMKILINLDKRIEINGCLSGEKTSIADIAIFPFVRQYVHVDKDWFNKQPVAYLQNWLKQHLESDLFTDIMQKHPLWEEG